MGRLESGEPNHGRASTEVSVSKVLVYCWCEGMDIGSVWIF